MVKSDVAIVGANVAGSSLAKGLASRGVSVIVIERLKLSDVGSHTCGDGLDKQEFKRLGLDLPEGDFVEGDIYRAEAYAPDKLHKMTANGLLRAVNRYKFCQYLLGNALDAGAELMDGAHAVGPELKDGFVTGVEIKRSGKSREVIKARLVVDASGLNACIRKRLPEDWWVSEKIALRDTSVCYKETRIFPKPQPEPSVRGFVSSKVAPGGFYWLAMRSNTKINVGIGLKRTGGHPNPRTQIYKYVLPKHPELEGTVIKWHGGGMIPRRRPLECMVGNGFLSVGDAAAMVNPMSGGGIGPSMYAGKLGSELLPKALNNNNVSLEALWKFNYEYNQNYGFVQAANHVMRRNIEDLTDEQVNALFAAELFSEEELIEAIEKGSLSIGFGAKLKKLGKLAKHPRLLVALKRLYTGMKTAREIYQEYPADPEGFLPWRKKAREFFNKLGT
jgi:electron-transferring-flavoprotein dehydrogenase